MGSSSDLDETSGGGGGGGRGGSKIYNNPYSPPQLRSTYQLRTKKLQHQQQQQPQLQLGYSNNLTSSDCNQSKRNSDTISTEDGAEGRCSSTSFVRTFWSGVVTYTNDLSN